jgi:uncharacterized membrane protein YbhN (UPF0104 family)
MKTPGQSISDMNIFRAFLKAAFATVVIAVAVALGVFVRLMMQRSSAGSDGTSAHAGGVSVFSFEVFIGSLLVVFACLLAYFCRK